MRPSDVRLHGSGQAPNFFEGLSLTNGSYSLFDGRTADGDRNYPVGVYDNAEYDGLFFAHPDRNAANNMLFAESIELFVEIEEDMESKYSEFQKISRKNHFYLLIWKYIMIFRL